MDLNQHIAITSTDQIIKIVNPLTADFDIKHFRYLKLYNDGSRILLSNYPDCIRFMYQEGNYKKMWFDGEFPEKLTEGWHIWDVMRTVINNGEITHFEKEINHSLGLYHGLTYVSKGIGFYEIYTFDSNQSGIYQMDYKLLKYFMLYFKEQAKNLIDKSEYEKIIIPIKQHSVEPLPDLNQDKIKGFINNIRIKRYYLDGKYNGIYLTTKEVQCAYWLIQGKSAEEISIIESNTIKTIETHLENIRRKLNCSKQTQIVRVLLELGFLDCAQSCMGSLK